MNKHFTVGIALVSGLVGGLLTRYISPQVALAQSSAPVVKEVRAQSFTLVDLSNRTMGKFTVESQGAVAAPTRIVLRDENGREIWSAGGTGMLPLNMTAK